VDQNVDVFWKSLKTCASLFDSDNLSTNPRILWKNPVEDVQKISKAGGRPTPQETPKPMKPKRLSRGTAVFS
jgi:hypothetical protein